MVDSGAHIDDDYYIRKDENGIPDKCAKNPEFCEDGLSFSIWEKYDYDSRVMTQFKADAGNFPRKYIVSSGADYDETTAKACPGFAIFRQVGILWMFIYIYIYIYCNE